MAASRYSGHRETKTESIWRVGARADGRPGLPPPHSRDHHAAIDLAARDHYSRGAGRTTMRRPDAGLVWAHTLRPHLTHVFSSLRTRLAHVRRQGTTFRALALAHVPSSP